MSYPSITIRPIHPDDVPAARRLIISVARGIYGWPGSLDEILQDFAARGVLDDMEDVQAHYFERRGLFLGVYDGEQLVGTGAVRPLSETLCELKRMWLLDPYQGRGIGRRILSELLEFAWRNGYRTIRLTTDRRQERALRFYRRAGFQVIEPESDDPDDVFLELAIPPQIEE